MSNSQQFFKGFAGLVALIAVGSIAIEKLGWAVLHPYHWAIVGYNVALTLISFFIVRKGLATNDGFEFYNHFMGNATVRLLLTMAVLFAYYYAVKVEAVSFTVTFFVCYFTFTAFEIQHLLANLRQNSESLGNTDEKSTEKPR
jgi:hypothetical protein